MTAGPALRASVGMNARRARGTVRCFRFRLPLRFPASSGRETHHTETKCHQRGRLGDWGADDGVCQAAIDKREKSLVRRKRNGKRGTLCEVKTRSTGDARGSNER